MNTRHLAPAAALCAAFATAPATFAGDKCQPGWDAEFGDPGAAGGVRAWAVDPGAGVNGADVMYVGGLFQTIEGVAALRLACWDGETWTEVGGGVNAIVHAMRFYDDGSGRKLFVSGGFTAAGGATANRIVKWDGQAWATLGSGLSPSGAAATSMEVFDDGSGEALYVGGSFSTAGGVAATNIARWDGQNWSPVGGGFNTQGLVMALAVYDDGAGAALYAGGSFIASSGNPINRIAKWDGAAWSELGAGTNNTVNALATYDDGSGNALYAAGTFTMAGGAPAQGIARWNGATWAPLGAGIVPAGNGVRRLCVFDDGTGSALYAAGEFINAGGMTAARIARWSEGMWSTLGSGANNAVAALLPVTSGERPMLYIGGDFTIAGGLPVGRFTRWVGCAPPDIGNPADINGDGVVSAADLALLLGAWGTSAPEPDLNNDGVVNASDLALLLGAWG